MRRGVFFWTNPSDERCFGVLRWSINLSSQENRILLRPLKTISQTHIPRVGVGVQRSRFNHETQTATNQYETNAN
jgi:hypothetical protein